jgi:3-hydroxyisobutyrate dehydrogenase-like beta-hydroxyacid dehydrogenase/DNA-binding winged helix-turn-helix (wHTH) protein
MPCPGACYDRDVIHPVSATINCHLSHSQGSPLATTMTDQIDTERNPLSDYQTSNADRTAGSDGSLPSAQKLTQSTDERVGIVGLGPTGQALARKLLSNGYRLIVYDRDPERVWRLQPDGPRVAAKIADLAPCGIVLSSLPDEDALTSVVLSAGGLASTLADCAVHISTSVVDPAVSRRLASFHSNRGQRFVAAPILPHPNLTEASRFVPISGDRVGIERAWHVLTQLGQNVSVIGEDPGAANVTVLAANMLTTMMLESMGDVFALLQNSGIDLRLAFGARLNSPLDGSESKNSLSEIKEFGRFRLNSRRRELLADGEPVTIGSRALDVLIVLVNARGQLVTKDELLSRVWPARIVNENALHVQVSDLRKVLGPDRDFIKSVSGLGYRFIADVTISSSGSPK